MPIDNENRVDISGDPQPPRAKKPGSVQADTQRKVNNKQQGAQVQQGQPNPSGAARARTAPIKAQDTQQAQEWRGEQVQNRPYKGDNPIFEQAVNDPWYGYQVARNLWQSMKSFQKTAHDGVSTSVRNAWELYPAQADIASKALLPIEALVAPWSDQPGGTSVPLLSGITGTNWHGERIGQAIGQGTPEQQKQVTGDVAGDVASFAVDPESWLGVLAPQSRLARAGLFAYGAGTSLMESNQLDPTSLLWAGLSGMIFSGRATPPGMGAAIRKVIPSWDQIQDHMLERHAARIQKQFDDSTPEGRKKYFEGLIEDIRKKERMKASSKVIAEAGDPGEFKVDVTIKNYSEIKTAVAEQQKALEKRQKAFYKKYDVGDLPELIQKIEDDEAAGKIDMKQLRKDWQGLRLPHDLMVIAEGERPMVNPSKHLKDIPDEMAPKAASYLSSLRMWVDHAHRGPYGNDEQPMVSLWRSMIGFQRGNDWMHQHWMASTIRLLGDDAGKVPVQELLTRAAEGDLAAYKKLAPNQKMVVDGFNIMRATLRRQKRSYGMTDDFVANWWPRVQKIDPKKAAAQQQTGTGTKALLQGERKAHRALKLTMHDTVDDAGNAKQAIALTQKYDSVFDLNADMKDARSALEKDLLNPKKKITVDMSAPLITEIRQAIAKGDMAKARQWAKEAAGDIYPDYETQFLPALNRMLGKQMSAVHSHMAVQHLLESTWRGADGKPAMAAYQVQGMATRMADDLRRQNYREVNSPWFRGVIVNPEMADLLERGSRLSKTFLDRKEWYYRLSNLEAQVVKGIMYMPMIHGLNIAGRFVGAMALHPYTVPKVLYERMRGKMNSEDWLRMRMEAYRNGVIPNTKHTQFGSEVLAASADAMGDLSVNDYPGVASNMHIPQWAQHQGLREGYNLGKWALSPITYLNNLLWHSVGEFGVMMYHIEKEAALKGPGLGAKGMDEYAAGLYAARRANSWMGHVAPEDTNPFVHDLARMVTFAPNWWRSWAELLTGYYKRTGFDWTPQRKALAAANEIKVALAFYAAQKITGNAFNLALSGHTQDHNQLGAQDKIEITRPEILGLLQGRGIAKDIDLATGKNPKNGAVYTIENPLARQTYDVEELFGYQSGREGHELLKAGIPGTSAGMQVSLPPSIQAAQEGAARFGAARLSPIANAAAVLGNIDLYRTLATGQISHVNPYHDLPGLDNVVLSALSLLPFGSRAVSESQAQMHKDAQKGEPKDVPGPYGLPIPRSISNLPKVGLDAGVTNLLSSLTGVNPAHEHSERTEGQPLTDAQYRQVDEVTQTFKDRMAHLQAELVTPGPGQITPGEWRQRYQTLATGKAQTLRSLYKDSPAYVNGTMGLLQKYEALYDSAGVQMPDGTINTDALAHKQREFRQNLSDAERAAMDAELSKNYQKWPALKMFKDAQNSYHQFQDEWSKEAGIDPIELQQESHEFGRVFANQQLRTQFLSDHPEFAAWQVAKKQWEATPQGMPYGLFYDAPTSVNLAQQQGLDLMQLQQQAKAQAQAAAPPPPSPTEVTRPNA